MVTILNGIVIGLFLLTNRKKPSSRRVPWGVSWGAVLVCAIALPWYLYLVVVKPELLNYFLGDQRAGRVSGSMGHPHPWYYYAGVFPALGLPWILFAAVGARALEKRRFTLTFFLLLWGLTAPLFFSLPTTKLPLCVLPSYPALAILAAVAVVQGGDAVRRTTIGTGVGMAVAGIVLTLVALEFIPVKSGDLAGSSGTALTIVLLPVALVLIGAAGWATLARGRHQRYSLAGIVVALMFIPIWVFSHGDHVPFRSARIVGTRAYSEIQKGGLLVEYADLSAGVPFYAGQLPLLAAIPRELQFEDDSGESRILDEEKFMDLWNGSERVLAITRSKRADRLLRGPRAGMVPTVVVQGGGYVLVENRSPAPVAADEARDPPRTSIPLGQGND